jgi:hypothetical protein
MLLASIPQKFPIPFASGAESGFITQPIPQAAQPNGRASLVTGFSELNFDPILSGGIPPWGADFNGLLYQITQWLQWAAAGGFPVGYDATFAASIGGYPKYALLQKATGDKFWLSQIDNNLVNPDAGVSASWHPFPDIIVQAQRGNWENDVGAINAYSVTLSPLPASLASIKGSPIRFFANNPNSIINPVINIVNTAGDLPVTIINSNGSPLFISQIARAGQICEGFFDGTFFQLTSPAPIPPLQQPVANTPVVTGVIYEWPAEVPPTWGLECNGATPLIASYPNLFNVILTRFGGDGVNTFGLPDKRGAFTRGWDHGRGLDPNATTRTGNPFGNPTVVGDHVGSWERSALLAADLIGAFVTMSANPDYPNNNVFTDKIIQTAQQFERSGPPNLGNQFRFPWLNPMSLGTGEGVISGSNTTGPILTGVTAFQAYLSSITGGGAETRPVNIDMMYVIAF